MHGAQYAVLIMKRANRTRQVLIKKNTNGKKKTNEKSAKKRLTSSKYRAIIMRT